MDDTLSQARKLGMDLDSVVREAKAMGLDVDAVLVAYSRDYVDKIVDRQIEGLGIRVD